MCVSVCCRDCQQSSRETTSKLNENRKYWTKKTQSADSSFLFLFQISRAKKIPFEENSSSQKQTNGTGGILGANVAPAAESRTTDRRHVTDGRRWIGGFRFQQLGRAAI